MRLEIGTESPAISESIRLLRQHIGNFDIEAARETIAAVIAIVHGENHMPVARTEAVGQRAETYLRAANAKGGKRVQQRPWLWIRHCAA